MLLLRFQYVYPIPLGLAAGARHWGSPDGVVSVHGAEVGGCEVEFHVPGVRPFVTVVLPAKSPAFDEARAEELTGLLAPVLASAAGYRGHRFKLSFCTQALERTRVEYEYRDAQSEQPLRLGFAAPARTLRIVLNCSIVAAEVARVLQAPEAAAAAWTYPRSVDANSLVAMLGDARGGIRVLAPETASNPTACFAARTGVAPKQWCTADTAWPDVEHEHDEPVTLKLDQFHPADTPAKRKRRDAEAGDATCPERDWLVVEKEQLALAESWVARRAFDENLGFLLEAVLWKSPRLHKLFSEAELRNATCEGGCASSPFVVAVLLAQDRAEAEDPLCTERNQHDVGKEQQVEKAKSELAKEWGNRPAFADRPVFSFELGKVDELERACNETEKEKMALFKEQLPLAQRWVARRAFDEQLVFPFEAVMWKNPGLHELFSDEELRALTIACRRKDKDRRSGSALVGIVRDARDECNFTP
jgi:hypothetical protein